MTVAFTRGCTLPALSLHSIGNICTVALSSCTSSATPPPTIVTKSTAGSVGVSGFATTARAQWFVRTRVQEVSPRPPMLSGEPVGEASGNGMESHQNEVRTGREGL